jgi:hypothetical protein
MSYAERTAQQEKPKCWGSAQAYSPNDEECKDCHFQHTCRVEIERKGSDRNPTGFVPVRRVTTAYRERESAPSYRDRDSSPQRRYEDEGSIWRPGLTHQDESPAKRLGKDVFIGALRGGSKEMYEFFRHFRIR